MRREEPDSGHREPGQGAPRSALPRGQALLALFAATLEDGRGEALQHVRDYVRWQADQGRDEFQPGPDDDVDLRTYLMELRLQGEDSRSLRSRTQALRRFYAWAVASGLSEGNPFDEYNFDRPFLSRDQIRRRQSALDAGPEQRELLHLRALNRLVARLNRAPDVQAALDATLETLVEVMDLRTAWAFLTTGSGLPPIRTSWPEHGYFLAAACGLPPGLERQDRHYLRRPPVCHCQHLLREGRLTRAVNVVECTRLMSSANAAGDNRGLLYHATTPILAGERALGIINVATAEWQLFTAADLQFLSAVGGQVAAALERARLYDELNAQTDRLERELEMAHQVQVSLLPRRLPDLPGFAFAADWCSAREMAGDFYDLFTLPGGRVALVVADVSDKGAPAALYMTMTRSLLRENARRQPGPAALLHEINRRLVAHAATGMFVTLFYAILEGETRTLTYASAGHDPPLLRHAGGAIQALPPTGPLLGVFSRPVYGERTLQLAAGATLLAYTDGITDALNPEGETYGPARLCAALAGAPRDGARQQLDHVLAHHAAFIAGIPPFDDTTLLVVTGEAAEEKTS